MDDLADARRPRRRQDARRRRMGEGARARPPETRRADRAGRRDRARRARGDDRGRLRPARGASALRAAELDAVAAPRSNGRTAPSPRPSRRRIRKACAARNSRPPGAMRFAKWRHAEATFDMLQFGLRLGERPRQVVTTTPRPIAAAQAADRRPGDGADARGTRDECAQPVAGVPRHGGRRATAARGSAARSSTARSSRSAPTRCGRAPRSRAAASRDAPPLHASWSRSIRRPRLARRRRLRPGRRRPRRGWPRLCARRRHGVGPVARRLGGEGDRAVAAARPTRSSPRSTRAATWCAR